MRAISPPPSLYTAAGRMQYSLGTPTAKRRGIPKFSFLARRLNALLSVFPDPLQHFSLEARNVTAYSRLARKLVLDTKK